MAGPGAALCAEAASAASAGANTGHPKRTPRVRLGKLVRGKGHGIADDHPGLVAEDFFRFHRFEYRGRQMISCQEPLVDLWIERAILLKIRDLHDEFTQIFVRHGETHVLCCDEPGPIVDELIHH